MSELRRELTGRGKALELSQLSLHFEQPKVCIFELFLAFGDFAGCFVYAVFEAALFQIQLLGHLSYAAKHAIEPRTESSDFIGSSRLDFNRQVTALGLGHRQ